MIGYLDLPSGISGDMFLGCLLDAGWSVEKFRAAIQKLHLPEAVHVDGREVMKGPFRAMRAIVDAPGGEQPANIFTPVQGQIGLVQTHAHGHEHRNLDDIKRIIHGSDLTAGIKQKAIAVFTRLAHAEAKVHGTTVETIHFHEVGAIDAIVDIVCSVAGLEDLGIQKLYASALPTPHGWIDSQHGKLPLPAPATLEILSAAGAPTRPGPGPGELVTPTGAALVCELAQFSQPAMRLQRIAIGAGKRDTPWPNVARLWLGMEESLAAAAPAGAIVQIETNIDDMNPQLYAPLSDRLFATGALDVWMIPIQMKKSRPGVTLGILCPAGRQRELADIVLRETTTLGVRVHPVERYEAEREIRTLETGHGIVQVKLKKWGGRIVGAMPEYEDCRKIAEAKNLPFKMVYDSALAAAHRAFGGPADPEV